MCDGNHQPSCQQCLVLLGEAWGCILKVKKAFLGLAIGAFTTCFFLYPQFVEWL